MILNQDKRLDSAWVHHDSDPLSHGLRRKVASKLSSHRAGISVSSGHLAPDNPHLGLVGAPGDAGLVLGLVHVGAPLADVPPGSLLLTTALHLEQGGVLVLVPLAPLVAGEDRLSVQTPAGHHSLASLVEVNQAIL